MSDPAPSAELLRSLGRLTRGLSALFWGLPAALVIGVQTVKTDWMDPLGVMGFIPSLLAIGLLYYGLWLLGDFQKQERIWTHALDRAKLFGFINVGLAPFLYWLHRMPDNGYYARIVGILALCGLLFLFNLNQVLQRLTAMLPDETLRHETRFFTTLNLWLLLAVPLLLAVSIALQGARHLPAALITVAAALAMVNDWLFLFLVLLPLAMTMTLIWKVKEVVFGSVFGQHD